MQNHFLQFGWYVAGLVLAATVAAPCTASTDGEALFTSQCIRCHGEQGRGTDDFPTPLAGDLSVLQLAEQIRLTMPEDNPESLTVDEARAVAEYIHGAFYSSIAQARNDPPEIELARLTVNQYRRVMADLVGSFRPRVAWHEGGGLRGEYYDGRSLRRAKQAVATRTDPTIDFDFGTEVPLPEIKDAHAYSMRWSGALHAAETGWHEFVVRTEHAFRLWVNDPQAATIDSWVKSGDETEFSSKVFLLGGRAYPIRLEFSRGNQGVSDEKQHEKNKKTQPASIQLLWAPPHGAREVIPARHLAPDTVAESYVATTPFPPDDRSYGWERGTAVSQAWFDATTRAAIESTNYICDRIDELAGASDDDPQRVEKLRAFCSQVAERALRRPLDDVLRTQYVDQHFEATGVDDAVRRSLLMTFCSPRFLFRETSGAPDAYVTASRLAFTLWDSLPDDELLDAAAQGQLETDDQLRDQARRMLADVRGRSKLRQFLFSWLQVDSDVDLHKDPERFPEFDAQTAADLRTSLDLFLDEVVWSDASNYHDLFLADEVFLNERLARFYGNAMATEVDFSKTRLDNGLRAGVLTHPYVLSKFAHADVTSPIHRGVFLVRGVLGQALKPPPEAVAPLAADLHPELTTRERVALQTRPAACMTCHHVINPLGFTLERFDAVGRYRETEQDKPIDDRGEYQPPDGPAVTLAGARDLAEFLAGSDEVSAAFAEQLFRYFVQQSLKAYGPEVEESLVQSFRQSDYHIRQLALEVAVLASRFGRDNDLVSRSGG